MVGDEKYSFKNEKNGKNLLLHAYKIKFMINKIKYKKALDYTYKLHLKHDRKGGAKIPYFSHLSSVSNYVIENGGTTDEAIGALLHDAVEDQGGVKTLKEIRTKFGIKVATIVKECSDSVVEPKPPWFERKKKYI